MQRTGYHQMSMQALAEEAGVSVGLAYRYFGGKEDVLLAAIVDILDALRAELPSAADAAGDTAAQRLCAVFGAYVRVIDRYRPAVLLTYRESATLNRAGRTQLKDLEVATAAPLASAIRDGIASGEFYECDSHVLALGYIGMTLGAYRWLRPSGRRSAKEIAAEFSTALLRGLIRDEAVRVESPLGTVRPEIVAP